MINFPSRPQAKPVIMAPAPPARIMSMACSGILTLLLLPGTSVITVLGKSTCRVSSLSRKMRSRAQSLIDVLVSNRGNSRAVGKLNAGPP